MPLARSLGVLGCQLRTSQFGGEWDWAGIAHALVDAPRHALVRRTTRETRVRVQLDLDMVATPQVSTGLPFFDHMLDQLGQHGSFALDVVTEGDLQVDEHHPVEDTALALGPALPAALGDKPVLQRHGFTLPAGSGRPTGRERV